MEINKPLYIKLTSNDITCLMIKPIRKGKVNIIETINDIITNIKRLKPFFQKDFKHRFISLLSFDFKSFPIKLALHLLKSNITTSTTDNDTDHSNSQPTIKSLTTSQIELFLSRYDIKRMRMYSRTW